MVVESSRATCGVLHSLVRLFFKGHVPAEPPSPGTLCGGDLGPVGHGVLLVTSFLLLLL